MTRDEKLAYGRKYRKEHKDYFNKYTRDRYSKNKERWHAYRKELRDRVRQNALEAYGNKCVWCGQTNPMFLTFDHINNDGKEQRKKHHTGINLYYYLLKYLPKDIQILCWNCNLAKDLYGYDGSKKKAI